MSAPPCPHVTLVRDRYGRTTCTTYGIRPAPGTLVVRYERALGQIAALSLDEDEAVFRAAMQAIGAPA